MTSMINVTLDIRDSDLAQLILTFRRGIYHCDDSPATLSNGREGETSVHDDRDRMIIPG